MKTPISCPLRNCSSFIHHSHSGLTAITLLYSGSTTAETIVGYWHWKRQIVACTFYNVEPNQEVTCYAGDLGELKRKTTFVVTYADGEGECTGSVKTKCQKKIIGDSLKNCEDLTVISHIDGDGALCDAATYEAEDVSSSNALIASESTLDVQLLTVWEGLDPFVRYALIGIFLAFMALMICGCYLCVIGKNRNKSENDKISEARISSNIAMSPTTTSPANYHKDYHQDPTRGISKENVDTLNNVIKVMNAEFNGNKATNQKYPDPEIPLETAGALPVLKELPVLNEAVEVISNEGIQAMQRVARSGSGDTTSSQSGFDLNVEDEYLDESIVIGTPQTRSNSLAAEDYAE